MTALGNIKVGRLKDGDWVVKTLGNLGNFFVSCHEDLFPEVSSHLRAGVLSSTDWNTKWVWKSLCSSLPTVSEQDWMFNMVLETPSICITGQRVRKLAWEPYRMVVCPDILPMFFNWISNQPKNIEISPANLDFWLFLNSWRLRVQGQHSHRR